MLKYDVASVDCPQNFDFQRATDTELAIFRAISFLYGCKSYWWNDPMTV
jgi:hypothetical protein